MDPNIKAEVIATSYVPEGTKLPSLTAEQQRARDRAKQLRETYEKTKKEDPLAALKRPEGITTLSQIDLGKEIDRRIDKPEDGEPDRPKEALTYAQDIKTVAEQGIDGLSPEKQKDIIDKYVARVLDARPQFHSLSEDEKNAIARNELQRPENRAKLADALVGKLRPDEQIETQETRDLAAKKQEREDSEKAAKTLRKDIRKLDTDITTLQERSNEHQEIDPITHEEGKLHQRIREIQQEVRLRRISELRTQLSAAYGGQEGFTAARNFVAEQIKSGTPITDSDYKQMAELIDQETKLDELQKLISERDSIAQNIKEKEKEKKIKEKESRRITQRISEQDEDIEELDDDKDKKETVLVSDLENLIYETANDSLDEDLSKRAEALSETLQKEIDASNDADKKRLLEGLSDRFETLETSGKIRKKTIKSVVESSWKDFLTSGDANVSATVKSILQSEFIELPTDSDAEKVRKAEERARIDKRLTEDPDFAKNASSDYVTYLIAKRLESGNPLFEGEIKRINEFGYSGSIDAAIAKNKDIESKIDNFLGKTGEPKQLDRLKREYGSNWLAILALIIAGVAVPGAIAAKLTSSELGK